MIVKQVYSACYIDCLRYSPTILSDTIEKYIKPENYINNHEVHEGHKEKTNCDKICFVSFVFFVAKNTNHYPTSFSLAFL